jgi:alkaline phosphatase D
MHTASTEVRLLVSDGSATTLTSAESTDSDLMCRFDLTGFADNTAHTYQVQVNGVPRGPIGRFRTLPAAGAAASFTVAFSGDAATGSVSPVFNAIRAQEPLMFIHLGDLHYENISINNQSLFHAAYDRVLRSEPQARLLREVPSDYIPDDHCIGPNNADGTSASIPAATAVYRSRVPHYPLPDSVGLWHTFDVGRVRFIVTDQRSQASPQGNTDDSFKTMLGAAQKTWFKNLLSNSAGMLIVWVCPRWFGVPAMAGSDSWGGFTTERTELADYVKANCHGRVVVLSADLHTLAVDDGTNHDFATGGGEPLPCFQAAALDQTPVSGGLTYSHGEYLNSGQYGTMQIADSGGASIGVTWRGHDSTGAVLVTHAFSVAP